MQEQLPKGAKAQRQINKNSATEGTEYTEISSTISLMMPYEQG